MKEGSDVSAGATCFYRWHASVENDDEDDLNCEISPLPLCTPIPKLVYYVFFYVFKLM